MTLLVSVAGSCGSTRLIEPHVNRNQRFSVPDVCTSYASRDGANASTGGGIPPGSIVAVRHRGGLLYLEQELDVGLRLAQPVEQQLDGLLIVERVEHGAA